MLESYDFTSVSCGFSNDGDLCSIGQYTIVPPVCNQISKGSFGDIFCAVNNEDVLVEKRLFALKVCSKSNMVGGCRFTVWQSRFKL